MSSPEAATPDRVIIDRLVDMYQLDTTEYRVEVVSSRLKIADIQLEELSLRPLTQKEPLGLFSVKVDIEIDGQVVESGQVRLKIRKFAEVVVTADKIRRKDIFHDDNVATRRMEVTSLRERPVQSLAVLEGHRAKRNLRNGAILTTACIEAIPDMESGRAVKIVYVDGLCQVTAPGVAMEQGMAGDYVKVKNKASGKIIVARIVDNGAVAVDP
ncbi:MAG: flagellar basal body P-ring formation chaperone FlgA [candidate division Zixibacteria bacterium]|nr:flagellar basal body P-ring formation chaperone FlgA [candidate division Zixibacteria bacterium]